MTNRPPDRVRVLLIDDDVRTVRLATMALQAHGLLVEGYPDPLIGLAAAVATPPAAIVLDLQMPSLDGFAFLRALRHEMAEPPPVLVWTGKDLTSREAALFADAGVRVIHKGPGTAELVTAVLDVIGPADRA